MIELLRVTLLGLFFGTFGTTIGGIIGVSFKNTSNRFLSFVLSFAAGIMSAIICFNLIPEALSISNTFSVIIGVILGVLCISFCESIVTKKFEKKIIEENKRYIPNEKFRLLKVGIVTGIGLAIHNLPEGLAIGSGFEASLSLGYALAIAICIHDIPEGISMAVPMKNGGIGKGKVIFYVILSGITTGIGAFIGKIVGGISEDVIAMCLSFAAGAMLYIVSNELLPEANKLYNGRISTLGNILGFMLGIIAINLT